MNQPVVDTKISTCPYMMSLSILLPQYQGAVYYRIYLSSVVGLFRGDTLVMGTLPSKDVTGYVFFKIIFLFLHILYIHLIHTSVHERLTHVTDNLQPYNNITQNDPFPQFLQYSYNLYIDGNPFYTVIFLREVQNSPHLSKNLSILFKLFAISFSTSNSDLILLRKFGSIGIFSFNLQP